MSESPIPTPDTSTWSVFSDDTDKPTTYKAQDPPTSLGGFHTDRQRDPRPEVALNCKHIELPYKRPIPSTLSVGLTGLDLSAKSSRHFRIKTFADNITNESFDIHIDSWGDSSIHRGNATWFETVDPDIQAGTYLTAETRHWSKPQSKTSSRINFTKVFRGPPIVVCWLIHIDAENAHKSFSIKTYPTEIDVYGFTINIESWADSVLNAGGAGWMAYPSDKTDIYAGSAATMDGCNEKNGGHIAFPDGVFSAQPKVFMALSMLDFYVNNGRYNVRVKAHVDAICEKGMEWHADTWGNNNIRGAGLAFVAIA